MSKPPPPEPQKPNTPEPPEAAATPEEGDEPGIFDRPPGTSSPSPWRPRADGPPAPSPTLGTISFDIVETRGGRLTTHVLDTAVGRPARNMRIELFRLLPEVGGRTNTREGLADVRTNDDGRVPRPLLEGDELLAGQYELRFHVGDYYASNNHPHAWRFLDEVPIVFRVNDPSTNYHVPLLVTPWSYSTYRGS